MIWNAPKEVPKGGGRPLHPPHDLPIVDPGDLGAGACRRRGRLSIRSRSTVSRGDLPPRGITQKEKPTTASAGRSQARDSQDDHAHGVRTTPRRGCAYPEVDSRNDPHNSATILCLFVTICSIVKAVWLTLSRAWITCTEPSCLVLCISMPVSGGKQISFSCGYCEKGLKSAPRSIMPVCISNIVAAMSSFGARRLSGGVFHIA